MLVLYSRQSVEDVARRLGGHGARVLAEPRDRPAWGPNLRTAHIRTPDDTLVELQSYCAEPTSSSPESTWPVSLPAGPIAVGTGSGTW